MSAWSQSRFEFSLLVPDPAHFGSMVLMQSYSNVGSRPFVFGCLRLGFLASLSDMLHSGLSMLLQSFAAFGFTLLVLGMACSGFPPLVLDCAWPGSMPFVRDRVRSGSIPSTLGCSELGFLLSVLDFLHLGFLLPIQSSECPEPTAFVFSTARFEFPILMLDSMTLGPLLLSRSPIQLELTFLAFGESCPGPLLFSLDHAQIGSPLPLHSSS